MALNQWFKFYGGEYLSDPKIAALSPAKRSCWITILALASISSIPGQIEYLTVEVLLEKSGVKFDPYDMAEWNSCLGVLEEFVRMKMISKSDDGLIEVLNWTKRQEMVLTNAERQANYRRRNAAVTPVTTTVTVDKIREDENNTSGAAPRKIDVPEEEKSQKLPKAKYPNAKKMFALWKDYPKHWERNTTFLLAAEEFHNDPALGYEEAKYIIEVWYPANKDKEFCPQLFNPHDLLTKYPKIEAFSHKTT